MGVRLWTSFDKDCEVTRRNTLDAFAQRLDRTTRADQWGGAIARRLGATQTAAARPFHGQQQAWLKLRHCLCTSHPHTRVERRK
jgi:hypothetical protein